MEFSFHHVIPSAVLIIAELGKHLLKVFYTTIPFRHHASGGHKFLQFDIFIQRLCGTPTHTLI